MAGTTTRLSLPYPSVGDNNAVPADIQALATALDSAAGYEQGLAASIPAGTAKPNGYIYAATDDARVWVNVGTGGSRVYRQIAAADASGNVAVPGDVTVGDDLTVAGDAAVGATLAVTGTSTLTGNVTASGTINGQKITASPYFRAYRAASVSYVTGSTVVFDTDDADPNGWYDVATGRFQPTRAGRFHLTWAVMALTTLTADKFWRAGAVKNGSTAVGEGQIGFQRGTGGPVNSVGSTSVALNGSTDYVTIVLTHDVAATTGLSPGLSFTYFAGHYIGA